jgi:hypothetical protein
MTATAVWEDAFRKLMGTIAAKQEGIVMVSEDVYSKKIMKIVFVSRMILLRHLVIQKHVIPT